MHLVFVRHGRANGTHGRCIGHTDVPLSAAGARAMRALAASSPALGDAHDAITPVRIMSSDLQRAAASAGLLAQPWDLVIEHDARLREMHFGVWDGRPWSVIEAEDGARLRAWMRHWVTTRTPCGEGVRDVARRAASWLDERCRSSSGAGRTIIVVSHAGWIRAALCRLLHRPLRQMFELPADHAHATIVALGPHRAHVVAWNAARW